MKVKLAQVLAAVALTAALGVGGFSLAAAQDSTTTTAPTDETSPDAGNLDEDCPHGDV
jgi:hypothetical protein